MKATEKGGLANTGLAYRYEWLKRDDGKFSLIVNKYRSNVDNGNWGLGKRILNGKFNSLLALFSNY
jgi:hypothetical protein